MSTSTLIKEQHGKVLVLKFNRPDRLNAINGELMDELKIAVEQAANDNNVRALILTGAGTSFCSGGDVRDGARIKRKPGEPKPTDMRQALFNAQFERTQVAHLLHTMPKPTIALVRGAAMGAGMALALACDYRIIADSTVFRSAFVNNALSGDYGMAYFLNRAIGATKAMELIMLSPKLLADDIEQLGLTTQRVSDETLETVGLAFAQKLAEGPTFAYARVKQNLVAASTLELPDYLAIECENQVACVYTKDIREAAKAFIEKRKPVFIGE